MRKKAPLSPRFEAALKAAKSKVNALFLDLQEPIGPEIVMEVPVIAFDKESIVWGELGLDYGDKTVIALPISELTEGRLRHVTPDELCLFLFEEDVGEEVMLTLALAMVFSYAINHSSVRDWVNELIEDVKACVAKSVAKCVQRAPAP